jgi:hypothetical protein
MQFALCDEHDRRQPTAEAGTGTVRKLYAESKERNAFTLPILTKMPSASACSSSRIRASAAL